MQWIRQNSARRNKYSLLLYEERKMGLAQRDAYLDAGGCVPELSGKHAARSFNGMKAFQVHHEHVARLKDYLCARTKAIPEVPLTCYSECLVAQCLQSERGEERADRELLDSVCNCCEEFHEFAAQSVLRTKVDMSERAADVMQSTEDLENASNSFLMALAELHVACKFNQ